MNHSERRVRAAERLRWADEERAWQQAHSGEESNRASSYEDSNRAAYVASGGKVGMPIPLMGRGVFWSRGWAGCPQCGGDVTEHQPDRMYMVQDRTATRIGWSCTGQPGTWET